MNMKRLILLNAPSSSLARHRMGGPVHRPHHQTRTPVPDLRHAKQPDHRHEHGRQSKTRRPRR
jgi:hypothetical protein